MSIKSHIRSHLGWSSQLDSGLQKWTAPTVGGWNPANQLRLVVEIPLFTTGFFCIQPVVGLGISAINTIGKWLYHRPGELRGPGFVPWDTMKKTHPRWEFFVFHIFWGIFTPIFWGKWFNFPRIFLNGLVQPPTSNPGWCFSLCIAHCEFPRITFTALKRGTRGNQANLYPQKKLTWQWKITIYDRRYHCHVSFRECMF